MRPEHALRIEQLFEVALALEGPVREEFLAGLQAEDPALREEIETLLEHDARTSRFLAAPAWRGGEAAAVAPARIGPFRILRELGSGGMGVVYLAEQERPRRRVALKVVRPGLADRPALRRFEHEVEALARLKHAGIAQVFESGHADWGFGLQPYVAMEYVEGPSLAEHVAATGLDTRGRLELFAGICGAIEHAHQRGVIHRDLKPSNVLVDPGSSPPHAKVVDFGIARLLGTGSGTTSLLTEAGQVLGTLAYMSPEQASGDPARIDARSDVYALGVIGYELIAGCLPLDLAGKPLAEAALVVRDEEPRALSRAQPHLRGDLETIFAKTLEKDPARRYGSAAELEADVRRYLADQPVLARPASKTYLLSKFARRNRVLVGGVLGTIVALAVGLAATLRQVEVTARERDRADLAARRAERVALFQREMLSRVQPDLDGREVRLADVLDAAAAALPGDLAGDPAVEGGVRAILGESYLSLGLLEAAERELRAARPLLAESLGEAHDETLRAAGWLATVVADRGRHAEALELAGDAHARWVARSGRRHPEALVIELNQVDLLLALGREQEALHLARENLELRREVFGEGDPRTLNGLAILGQLLWALGEVEEAEPLLRQSLAAGIALEGERHPRTVARRSQLANLLFQQGASDEAEALFREALAVGRELLGDEHFELLAVKHNLAKLLERRASFEEAETLYREVVAAHARSGSAGRDAWTARQSLALLLAGRGRVSEAEALFAALVDEMRAALPPEDAMLTATVAWLERARGELAR